MSKFVSLLKLMWKIAPQQVRYLLCVILCFFGAKRRRQGVGREGPTFICGAFRSASGLGQGARLYATQCEKKKIPVYLVDITDAMGMARGVPGSDGLLSVCQARAMGEGGTVVIHANPPQFQLALVALGRRFLRNKRVIGYWVWEMEVLPPIWKHACAYVDKIEMPSSFVLRCLEKEVPCVPLQVKPHILEPQKVSRPQCRDRKELRCLSIFDAGSSFERKNPLAALRAFKLAFPEGEARLTFHVTNPQADPRQFEAFCQACMLVPGVRICTDLLGAQELKRLYLNHDIYISLHRSEGYGLTLAEAMQYGLHVVATGWSGNMDFMEGPLAHPVPYVLVPATVTKGPFKGLKARWAEADVRQAASILRCVASRLDIRSNYPA